MGSERMPGKVLKDLAGIPALVHIFGILRKANRLDDFAVVTTVLKEDDAIEKICVENSVKTIRGSVSKPMIGISVKWRHSTIFGKPGIYTDKDCRCFGKRR